MTITKKQTGATLEVTLDGRLDTTTAPEVEAELKGSLNGIKSVTMDFSKVEYISSAGLRVLLSVRKALGLGNTMKITNVNDIAREVFTVTGFDSFLTIE